MQCKYYQTLVRVSGLNLPWLRRWYVTLWMQPMTRRYCSNYWSTALVICLLPMVSTWAHSQPREALNPDVLQSTIDQTICVVGYTKTVRPSTLYTNAIKKRQMLTLGIAWENAKDYQLDHTIALSLGGHPRALSNLKTLHLRGADGAHRKDALSKRLQCLVCTGRVELAQAQADMYGDWQASIDKYKHQRCSRRRYEGD
jgi:hypothetical protein